MSYIINVYQEEMEISVRNNITLNFFKYVHQFVNQTFIKRTVKNLTKEEYKDLSVEEKVKYNNERNKENSIIKELR